MKEKIKSIGKVLLSFGLIYFISSAIMEGIIIAGFGLRGYDILKGNMPTDYWVQLLPLYGLAGFTLLTILVNHMWGKKKLVDIRISLRGKKVSCIFEGLIMGIFLTSIVIIILCVIGAYKYEGVSKVKWDIAFITFLAYLIQGMTEEIMCRGFVQNRLEEKVSRRTAIFFSACVFIVPHLSSMSDMKISMIIISILNLFLVSFLFSMSMIYFENLWVPIGIHVGWNYMLFYFFGLELTGTKSSVEVMHFKVNPLANFLHGGAYGIEAGIIVTIILLICDIILVRLIKEN